jgi:hypothetical protein
MEECVALITSMKKKKKKKKKKIVLRICGRPILSNCGKSKVWKTKAGEKDYCGN